MCVRLFVFIVSVALSSGTALRAEVDCDIVARIERAHGAIWNLRSNPNSQHGPSNLAILVNALRGLNVDAVQATLADHYSPQEANDLTNFVQLTKAATPRIRETSLSQFTASLHTTQWNNAVDRAEVALRHMPCGTAHTGTHGDAEGRELPGETTDAADVDRQYKTVEDPVEKAAGFIGLLIVLVWAARHLLTWFRRRAVIKRRQSKRFATSIQTHLIINARIFEAEIVDLSCHGAKVRYWHGTELDSNEPASVMLNDEQVYGSGAWSNPLYFAIKFDQPLPIPMVRELADVSSVDGLGRPKVKKKKAATA